MDHEGTAVDDRSGGSDSGLPDVVRPPRRLPVWPFALVAFLLAFGVGLFFLPKIQLPYYTFSPGPVYDTADFIVVPQGHTDRAGQLFFLTVSLKTANPYEWLGAKVDPKVDLVPRLNVRPPGVSPEQLRRENLAAMEQAKTDATYVALTKLGYDVTLKGTGALVIDTVEGSAAKGVLLAGDVIIELDGHPIEFRSDVIELLKNKKIGDSVELVVERSPEGATEPERKTVTIVLGPHVDDPSRPMIGVLLDNNEPIIEFPIEVDIDSRNIGGPSAGMMFTLQIMNELSDESPTRGHRIAGTGTISRDGTVGPIGGIRQKVYAAIDAGAEYMLVPVDNYDEALTAADDHIQLVKVATIDDAIAFLRSLPPVTTGSGT